MISLLFNNPFFFFLWFIALITGITIHEFSHAYAADRLGDPTPRLMGRLTLNPKAHLDLVGTLMILFAKFGWGKPVQVDPFNFRHPRRDNAIVSLAGPTSNLILATVLSLILRIFPVAGFIIEPLIIMNVTLAIFNLIPIHPLDGFAIVEGILPEGAARQWATLRSLGIFMIFILVFPLFGSSPVLNLIDPVINGILNLLLQ